jgi:hypothetical protein
MNFPAATTVYQSKDFIRPKGRGVNDPPHSGWLGFYRHRREKTGARSAPVVAGLENPIKPLSASGGLVRRRIKFTKRLSVLQINERYPFYGSLLLDPGTRVFF